MSAQDDTAEVRDLPKRGALRHAWGAPVAANEPTRSGAQETHRTCSACGLIKITVHPPHGNPYRLWQYPDGERHDGLTPFCVPQEQPFQ